MYSLIEYFHLQNDTYCSKHAVKGNPLTQVSLGEINTLTAYSPSKHAQMSIAWETRCAQTCSERFELEETLLVLLEIEPVFVHRTAVLLYVLTIWRLSATIWVVPHS